MQFQATHSTTKIQQWAFKALKPYFVKPCNKCNVYCCKYHVELDMLKQGLNKLRMSKRELMSKMHCGCEYSICKVCDPNSHLSQAHDKVCFRVTMLWEKCVCPKPKL